MKVILSIMGVAVLFFGLAQAAGQDAEETQAVLKSREDRISYSLGYSTGRRMKKEAIDIDPVVFSSAFAEGFAGSKAAMTDQEMRETLGALQNELNAKQPGRKKERQEKNKELAEKNRKEGEAFLAENSGKEGVVTLPSGLQYKVLAEGTGRRPATTGKVTVHYRATIIDGTEFYSTHKSGKPVTNEVGKFIKGMSEALQLMQEGSRWVLYVPARLAYGARGLRGRVGPDQTLIFEVELISVQS